MHRFPEIVSGAIESCGPPDDNVNFHQQIPLPCFGDFSLNTWIDLTNVNWKIKIDRKGKAGEIFDVLYNMN